jgi:uncharacterized protein YggE
MRILALTICAVLVTATTAASQAPSAASAREPEIVASGMAEVHTPPTFANVTISVTTNAGTAADAASQNATRMSATMSALRQAGIAAPDISTQGYSIEQAYDNQGRHRGGFTARNALLVKVNQIERIGAVIDATVAAGATEISSIQYGSGSMDETRRAAMTEAVKRARADAALIANAAGGTLGRLISMTSSSNTPPGYGRLMNEAVLTSAMSPAPPTSVIAPSDLSAIATAYGRWEFVPGPSR